MDFNFVNNPFLNLCVVFVFDSSLKFKFKIILL